MKRFVLSVIAAVPALLVAYYCVQVSVYDLVYQDDIDITPWVFFKGVKKLNRINVVYLSPAFVSPAYWDEVRADIKAVLHLRDDPSLGSLASLKAHSHYIYSCFSAGRPVDVYWVGLQTTQPKAYLEINEDGSAIVRSELAR